MSIIRNSKVVFSAVLLVLAITMVGCKSKKKAVKSEVENAVESVKPAANVGLVKNQLRQILTDTDMSVADMEKKLAELKAKNIQDAEVQKLIQQIEDKISKKKAENAAMADKASAMSTTKEAVMGSFGSIAKAANFDTANDIIDGTLSKFESPDVPVLIIIAEEGGEKDYDKPTTIGKYLEYIKMQKRFEPKVEEIVRNTDGKITRLVLRK